MDFSSLNLSSPLSERDKENCSFGIYCYQLELSASVVSSTLGALAIEILHHKVINSDGGV